MSDLLDRARKWAPDDLDPILDRVVEDLHVSGDDDVIAAFRAVLGDALNDAWVCGFNFGVTESAARLVEQGFDPTIVQEP